MHIAGSGLATEARVAWALGAAVGLVVLVVALQHRAAEKARARLAAARRAREEDARDEEAARRFDEELKLRHARAETDRERWRAGPEAQRLLREGPAGHEAGCELHTWLVSRLGKEVEARYRTTEGERWSKTARWVVARPELWPPDEKEPARIIWHTPIGRLELPERKTYTEARAAGAGVEYAIGFVKSEELSAARTREAADVWHAYSFAPVAAGG